MASTAILAMANPLEYRLNFRNIASGNTMLTSPLTNSATNPSGFPSKNSALPDGLPNAMNGPRRATMAQPYPRVPVPATEARKKLRAYAPMPARASERGSLMA